MLDSFLPCLAAQVDDPLINVHRPLSCAAVGCGGARQGPALPVGAMCLCVITSGFCFGCSDCLLYVGQPFPYCVQANMNVGCFDRVFF